jgi:hypothetical protein
MPYETVSPDDAHSILYGTSPRESIVVQPSVSENTPIAPKKELKKEKKNEAVVPPPLSQQVTNIMDVLQDNTPAPVPVSPLPQATNTIGDLLNSVKDNWMALAIPPAAYGAYKAANSIVRGEPKPADPTTPIADRQITRIEPQMDVNQQPKGRVEPTFEQPKTMPTSSSGELPNEVLTSPGYKEFTALEEKTGGPITTATDLKMIQQSEANRIAKEQEAKAKAAGVTPSISVPEAQTLVTTAEAAKDPVEKAKEAIAPKELRTGSGMPAFQGAAPPGTPIKRNLGSISEFPSTHAFVPGGQYMDIVRNAVGQDAFTASLLKEGGYPQTPEEAYSLARLINEKSGRMPRDVAKDLNIGLGETTKAITQKNSKGSKAFQMAGLTGALVLMADLANAKTPQAKREAMRNLGEAILSPSMTATEAGAPTLPPNAYSESRKLGSPFRQQLMGVAPPTR